MLAKIKMIVITIIISRSENPAAQNPRRVDLPRHCKVRQRETEM
jgi:hypothetical protein